jgi:uncharacterized tellurite resistance protein B-like protein
MDYAFLPEKIKSFLASAKPGEPALCVVRGSGGFSGEPGESYVAVYADMLFLFGKSFGEKDFINRKVDYVTDAPEFSLHQEKFSCTLELNLADGKLKMRLSSLEAENCSNLLKQFGLDAETPPAVPVEVDNDVLPDPLTALAACMKHIAASDNEVTEPELRLIEGVCQNNQEVLARAESYFRRYSFIGILDKIKLDEQQKLCFLANLYELAMSDGMLRSAEQHLINEFVRIKEIDPEKAGTVREVLLIKNQLSALVS